MIQVDHIGIAARNTESSARRLAEILGGPPPIVDGADDDMYRLDLAHGTFVLFNPAEKIDPSHVAFRVDQERFDAIVTRLRTLGVPFGNRYDDTNNGRSDDVELGGDGRVYFLDENGHLFEVTC